MDVVDYASTTTQLSLFHMFLLYIQSRPTSVHEKATKVVNAYFFYQLNKWVTELLR